MSEQTNVPDTYVCPECGSDVVLGHSLVPTDRLCLNCGNEWSVVAGAGLTNIEGDGIDRQKGT